MEKFWAHLISTQPDPESWVVAVSALGALVLVGFRMPWQVSRGLITIAHEGGHALMALVTRRKLEGIRLHSDTSGVTLTRGRPTGPGMVLTAMAGYMAPPLLGLAAAWLTEMGHITLLIWSVLLFLVCMLLLIRNLYGALILLATGGAVFALIMYAPADAQQVVALVAVWFLLFGGIRPIIELQRKRSRRQARDSDADQLARLTFLPGGFYVFFFLLVAIVSAAFGAYLMNPL
ncbi:M50 family peptidase [Nonomuraea phyllanthi]|uniref:M50 family peptidase n=1 Tax=Nonomuraea phyllanthi TaxID=2219224 RepID=A0A5C4V3M4_9ACTN|nr:M50 family metallopeptidase [Nonomuraea phyllanthi]KAB8185699.1 M50 family peptidase [Nonomuraea phyllanthi]QFY11233.1 M50 family peptidase [Nonomuraea phyllanthi]HET8587658.1 M50 family metallopeptidase [Candidatus Limnocylindria bacterium]